MMMAVMNPEGIYHCTKRGFHIQTTPLSGNHQLLLDQVNAFNKAKDEMGAKDGEVTLTLSRVAHMASSQKEKQRKVKAAHHYYGRFNNVHADGPGIVEKGMIKPLPCKTPIEELGASLLIGTSQEVIDKLVPYAELGIDRVILNLNFGLEASETLEAIEQFAQDVMPHFSSQPTLAAE
jgi:alkanesulfonate monooxygenase SsuD/methylene tetrahydromethanopterin reductase-like flavin-dependent oxidoreductase (luciferase family)